MNEYSDIEIKTAENLLKEGYKWLYRSSFGTLYAYETKPLMKEANFGGYDLLCKSYVPIFESVKSCDEPISLESIVHPQVLDDAEKRYLSAVIRPFRDQVAFICKVNFLEGAFQHIVIGITNDEDIALPLFESGTMYKGMKPDHGYSLEELGL